jgi:hypothetical protein
MCLKTTFEKLMRRLWFVCNFRGKCSRTQILPSTHIYSGNGRDEMTPSIITHKKFEYEWNLKFISEQWEKMRWRTHTWNAEIADEKLFENDRMKWKWIYLMIYDFTHLWFTIQEMFTLFSAVNGKYDGRVDNNIHGETR